MRMIAWLARASTGMRVSASSGRVVIDCYDTGMDATVALDWGLIDTVLLDMDGTLLDLRYDNWFWSEHVPRLYGERQGLGLAEAQAELAPLFRAVHGTMDWYCIEYWIDTLGIDIATIKRATLHAIDWLPGARQFLERLQSSGKRRIHVTNAH